MTKLDLEDVEAVRVRVEAILGTVQDLDPVEAETCMAQAYFSLLWAIAGALPDPNLIRRAILDTFDKFVQVNEPRGTA